MEFLPVNVLENWDTLSAEVSVSVVVLRDAVYVGEVDLSF